MIEISVIIPTYKPKSYIYDCLSSLIRQTIDVSLYEVLVVLNGDKDPYYKYISNIIKSLDASNIKLFYINERGVSKARNYAIDISQGKYIAFIDDDDYISDNYILELYTKAKRNVLPLSNMIAFCDKTNNIVPTYISRRYEISSAKRITQIYQVREYFSTPCAKLIPKAYIQDYRFKTQFKNSEDALFMFAISCNIRKIEFADSDVVYYRRIRENSANFRVRRRWDIICNDLKILYEMSRYFFRKPFKYHTLFTLTRPLAMLNKHIQLFWDKSDSN